MPKLYSVTCSIEFEVLCLAESSQAAIDASKHDYVSEELRNSITAMDYDCGYAQEITRIKQVPEEWRGVCLYGTDADLTPEQYLAEKEANPCP
jgi:hypothetical protein